MEAMTMPAQGSAGLHQFGRPRGRVGWLVGHLMALKNDAMNRAALDHLDLQAGDRVLEIGYGPGRTLKQAARRLERGLAAGLDHSEVMARQAARRCRRLIRQGRVEVKCGGVSEIPYADGSFDKAYAVNCFQFWPSPVNDLREVRRVLRPGGRLVLTIRAAERPLRFDLARASGGLSRVERARQAMAAAGFEDIAVHRRKAGRLLAVSVVGRRSGGDA
ncbi:MAG: methyltransferase domain-containing protein, partial [Rhodospirillales bacterium]|nr:methyltransferase domain-containing protein [Rhodospirillales bacterium]